MGNGTDVLISWDDAYDDMSSQEVPYARDKMGLESWWHKSLLATTLLLSVG